MAFRHQLVLTAGALALAGCTSHSSVTPASLPALPSVANAPISVSADPWVLSTDAWSGGGDARQPYLGNGFLGQRFDPSGTGLSAAGAEPAFMAGYYLREGLNPVPSLFPLRIEANGKVFGADPSAIRKYHQELRLKEGMLVTQTTWDPGAGPVDLTLEAAPLRQNPQTCLLRLTIRNGSHAAVSFGVPDHLVPVQTALKSDSVTTYSPPGLSGMARCTSLEPIALAAASAPFAAGYQLPSGKTEVGAITRDLRPTSRQIFTDLNDAHRLFSASTAARVSAALDAHRAAWGKLWDSDIEIDGDPEAQEVVRTCLFYLLCSVRADSDAGVPPMGLSSGAFSGHVFWDMDSWMLPALLPLHPDLARAMLEYRYKTLAGARANAHAEGLPGASYAWESASTGNETLGPGAEFRHGRHVTGDVALAMRQYYRATGDKQWLGSRAFPVLSATADNWVARAQPDGKGGFVIRKVTTPDENAGLVNDSAWTQYVARVNLEFAGEAARSLGKPVNPKWESVAHGLGFLRDPHGMILAYAGFSERTRSKQADALLLGFPGEASLPAAELGKMYDFYAPRAIKNGPAMTDAIHALLAARLGRGAEALSRFRDSYRPFVRAPFLLFSEKRTRENLCFLTGASGVLEAVLYGFGGIHLEPQAGGPSADHPELQPHLPPGWNALRIRNLRWRQKQWDVEIRPGAPPVWTAHH